MAGGGKREGAGRKPGSVNQMSRKAREEAAKTGELPHEFLLRIARGESIDGHAPAFNERMDAAKAAAPYFAPKLAATELNMHNDKREAKDLTDAELLAVIAKGQEKQ
jgi:hypothetical protein